MSDNMQSPLPTFTSVRAITFPVDFRVTITIGDVLAPLPPTTFPCSSILVFAPYNNFLGQVSHQAGAPSLGNLNLPVFAGYFEDAFLTSLMTTVPLGVYTNVGAVRWKSFCVEVGNSAQLATVGGSAHFCRWNQAGVPLVAAGATSTVYAGAVQTIFEATDTVHLAMAGLSKTKCYPTAMYDRSALNFSTVSLGGAPWIARYAQSQSNTADPIMMPWHPIVLLAEAPALATLDIIVRGELEYVPVSNSFLYKIARPLSITGPNVETQWWRHQDKILKVHKLFDSVLGMSREIGGFIGTMTGPKFGPEGNTVTRAARAAKKAMAVASLVAPHVEDAVHVVDAANKYATSLVKRSSLLPMRRSRAPLRRRLRRQVRRQLPVGR